MSSDGRAWYAIAHPSRLPRMRTAFWLLAAVSISSCTKYIPPAPPTPRAVTSVAAPFDRAWDSVIDVFASRVITVDAMERASGFIVASSAGIAGRSKADSAAALALADCGLLGAAGISRKVRYLPDRAKYNVLVRPSGSSSTVQVTAKFLRVSGEQVVECSSTGAFETNFEQAVKAKAEAPIAR